MIQPHAWRIYIYIAQCNSCVEWIGNGCRICTFRLYGLFFDQRKMGKEKKGRMKKSLEIIDDRPTEEENFFRPIQITSSAHKSSSFSPINSRGAPATVPATLARIHPRRDEKRRGNRLRVKARDFSISYSTVPYRSFLYRNRDVP